MAPEFPPARRARTTPLQRRAVSRRTIITARFALPPPPEARFSPQGILVLRRPIARRARSFGSRLLACGSSSATSAIGRRAARPLSSDEPLTTPARRSRQTPLYALDL